MLVLQRWRPEMFFRRLRVTHVLVWGRMSGVPFEYYDREAIQMLGGVVGGVEEVGIDGWERWEKGYLCARVWVRIDDPIVPGFYTQVEGGRKVWIYYEYERVHKICQRCGRIGHTAPICPIEDDAELNRFLHRNFVRDAKAMGLPLHEESSFKLYTAAIQAHRHMPKRREEEGRNLLPWREKGSQIVEMHPDEIGPSNRGAGSRVEQETGGTSCAIRWPGSAKMVRGGAKPELNHLNPERWEAQVRFCHWRMCKTRCRSAVPEDDDDQVMMDNNEQMGLTLYEQDEMVLEEKFEMIEGQKNIPWPAPTSWKKFKMPETLPELPNWWQPDFFTTCGREFRDEDGCIKEMSNDRRQKWLERRGVLGHELNMGLNVIEPLKKCNLNGYEVTERHTQGVCNESGVNDCQKIFSGLGDQKMDMDEELERLWDIASHIWKKDGPRGANLDTAGLGMAGEKPKLSGRGGRGLGCGRPSDEEVAAQKAGLDEEEIKRRRQIRRGKRALNKSGRGIKRPNDPGPKMRRRHVPPVKDWPTLAGPIELNQQKRITI
ncbi:OLC1v1035666C1 [Oldenlandia corymbosa var. corymbosa]|uniref:OLC1v1035666C1 n=1 Tax=Oldenlandia corymbosa var. corymbosa TaxID=529605 RepID=A0AAV1CWP0_OLDCO|nr:OLC1v1035666C1 [Oldenlandia corymbosa var. corymbosa]